jgi:hypothetical protein
VVDLVGLELVEQLDQRDRIGEIAVVREQAHALLVGVVVEVVDPVGVEARRAPDDAVHLVALLQQELGQVGTVLAGDAGDKGALFFGVIHGSARNGRRRRAIYLASQGLTSRPRCAS